MKALYDDVSYRCSSLTTRAYSTSFSLGVRLLHKRFRAPIYGLYGFVRFADEIVDTFHDFDKEELLARFREDTYRAIDDGISLNPILQAFQLTVHQYNIERELIDTFLRSMEMDLNLETCDTASYEEYILGSAEVVGLMCLRVFTEGDNALYERLKDDAMSLGAAFQKVNFLRDMKADYESLGRSYFPGVDLSEFNQISKDKIEAEIEEDFKRAREGIKKLPKSARFGVYLAFTYYNALFKKIRKTEPEKVLEARIRIPNPRKYAIMCNSYLRHRLNRI